MTSRTICVVSIGGADVSSAVLPRLTNLSVSAKSGGSADTVQLEFDDAEGIILLPTDGVPIEVSLGDDRLGVATVFSGTVDEIRSRGDRTGGRILTVSGKGVDTKGKAKEPQNKHWDDKALSGVFEEAARLAGINGVRVDPSLGSITRPYWAMQGESFLHWGERIAREVGGTFKVANGVAMLGLRSGGISPTGTALASVRAVYGDNLIAWDISPILGRPRYSTTRSRWYDSAKAEWQVASMAGIDTAALAQFTDRFTAADSGEAQRNAASRRTASDREKGAGSVTINGDNSAEPEGTAIIVGARPGIDGSYRIDAVNHDFSRGSGWTTKLDLKQPHGEAGQDGRA